MDSYFTGEETHWEVRPLSPGLTTRPPTPLSRSSCPLAIPLHPPCPHTAPVQGHCLGWGGWCRVQMKAFVTVTLPSGWQRARLHRAEAGCATIVYFRRAFLWPKGLQKSRKTYPFCLCLGTWEITIELEVLVFRTQCLELGFLLLFLKTEPDEKKKKKSGVAQVAGGKPSSNLRPREDRDRDTAMEKES